MARHALGGREVADRVVGAEDVRVAVDDVERHVMSPVARNAGRRVETPRSSHGPRCAARYAARNASRDGQPSARRHARAASGRPAPACRSGARRAGGARSRRGAGSDSGRPAPWPSPAAARRRARGRPAPPAVDARRTSGCVGAVDELQRLGQELDVDQAAAAELHVPAARRLLAQLDLHARAHLADLLERALAAAARRRRAAGASRRTRRAEARDRRGPGARASASGAPRGRRAPHSTVRGASRLTPRSRCPCCPGAGADPRRRPRRPRVMSPSAPASRSTAPL